MFVAILLGWRLAARGAEGNKRSRKGDFECLSRKVGDCFCQKAQNNEFTGYLHLWMAEKVVQDVDVEACGEASCRRIKREKACLTDLHFNIKQTPAT